MFETLVSLSVNGESTIRLFILNSLFNYCLNVVVLIFAIFVIRYEFTVKRTLIESVANVTKPNNGHF